jgi:ABC-2 type transport system permease protein
MNQWLTLFQKEILEMWRNFKWIWFPLSFILLGVSEPLSTYYMPQIIDSLGGLPDGAVIEIPTPSSPEILFQSISQYNTIGLLIIVLASMGLIAAERKSGVAELILVKPVSYFSYVTAKWAGAVLLTGVSYFLGLLSSWYYVVILFEKIPFGDVMVAFGLFWLWLSFVLTITVFFNALFKSPGVVGFISMATIIILSLISGSLSHLLEWSPTQLTGYAGSYLISGTPPDDVWGAVAVSGIGIVILLSISIYVLRKKELA